MTLLVVVPRPGVHRRRDQPRAREADARPAVATPISSLAIVVGKLLCALVYVFLLIAASIPLMAIVFVFGGVGPDDVLRGYVVLIVTALGLGSFGLLCSSLVKRTTAATASRSSASFPDHRDGVRAHLLARDGHVRQQRQRAGRLGIQAPAVLAYINPFIAQADVMCGTETTFGGGWCSIESGLLPDRNWDLPVRRIGPAGAAPRAGRGREWRFRREWRLRRRR